MILFFSIYKKKKVLYLGMLRNGVKKTGVGAVFEGHHCNVVQKEERVNKMVSLS